MRRQDWPHGCHPARGTLSLPREARAAVWVETAGARGPTGPVCAAPELNRQPSVVLRSSPKHAERQKIVTLFR